MTSSRLRARSYRKHGPNQPPPIQESLVLEESVDPPLTFVTVEDLAFLFMLLKQGYRFC